MTTHAPVGLQRRYPSPPWLSEPARLGKPTPDDLLRYKEYFRYQIQRGVAGRFNFQAHTRPGVSEMGDLSLEMLRLLRDRGPMTVKRMTEATGADLQVVRDRLRHFATRRFTDNISEDDRCGLYRIAAKGLAKIEGGMTK